VEQLLKDDVIPKRRMSMPNLKADFELLTLRQTLSHLSPLLSVSLSVVYLAQNNAKTKLSLHNNRRNGVPQAAFKYKYLQLEQKNHQKAAAGQKVKSFLRFTGNFPISPCFSLSLSLSLFLFFSHSLFIYLCPAH